jgi:hypothetical protein
MATIFQKILFSKNECNLIDEIKMGEVEFMNTLDDKHMFTTEHYFIRKKRIELDATHCWHHAQGDDYKFLVRQNGQEYSAESQNFAKRMFMRMQNAYRKQKEL